MQLVENRHDCVLPKMPHAMEAQVYKKLVIVGDSGVGKTQLLRRYTAGGGYSARHTPTMFDTQMADVAVGLSTVELALWDTPGQEQHDDFRTLLYPDKDVAVVCFSVADPDSLDHVETKWMREVRHHCPDVPVLLVGLQKDTRKDKEVLARLQERNQRPVSKEQGQKLAQAVGADDYFECSARLGKGVHEFFHKVARMALMEKKCPL